MQVKTVQYYDWLNDVRPVLFDNICASLRAQGMDCPEDLHGGCFKDGKWVGHDVSDDYRNYWHVYIEYWGEGLRNDSYVMTYFPPNDVEEWEELRFEAVKKYGAWAVDLINAVYKMLEDHKIYDRHGDAKMLIWFSW